MTKTVASQSARYKAHGGEGFETKEACLEYREVIHNRRIFGETRLSDRANMKATSRCWQRRRTKASA